MDIPNPKECKCGYYDWKTNWGQICPNCNKIKEPKKDSIYD